MSAMGGVTTTKKETPQGPWVERVTLVAPAWFADTPPRREWLLRDARTALGSGVLPLGKVGLLAAEGGAGKTMVLLALAVAVATATPWLGCLTAPKAGRALAILGEEDHDEVRRRLYYVVHASNGPSPDPGSIVVLPLAGVHCPMLENDERGNLVETPFFAWVREYVVTNGPWDLIVVDPLSRFGGKDVETDNAAATRFVQALESLATATGATVMVAHHTNKTARG